MMNNQRQPAGDDQTSQGDGGPVPVFRTWRMWYAVILGELVFLIVVFRLITVAFQ